jgi:hypothetical protein
MMTMRIGYMMDIIHKINRIKTHDFNNHEKLILLNELIAEFESVCEIPVDDPKALKEFKKSNKLLYQTYRKALQAREEVKNDI